MTTVVGTQSIYEADYLQELNHATLGTHDGSHCVLSVDGYTVTLTGSGLTYSGNHPSGGTMTGLKIDFAGDTTTWSNMSVSVSALWSAVSAGNITAFNNLLYSGNDTFTASDGFSGNFAGWAGNDVFNMQAAHGQGWVEGGDGNDVFNFAGDNFSAHVDGGAGTDVLNLNGDLQFASLDSNSLIGVETVHLGAGHHYDISVVLSTAVTIDGSTLGAGDAAMVTGFASATGAITFNAGAGDDVFISGRGNDVFNAGAGSDFVDYSNATSGVTVSLLKTGGQAVGGGMGTDTLTGVENINGSDFNDVLTGDAGDNVLIGGKGNDVLNGGDGHDTASFQDFDSGLVFDMTSGSIAGDTLNAIEGIIGTRYADTFIGDNRDNGFIGGGDIGGNDTVDYSRATGGLTFVQDTYTGAPTPITVTGGRQGTDTLQNMDIIVGSNFNDLFSFGGSSHPYLIGGAGTDTISFEHSATRVFVELGTTSSGRQMESIENLTGSAFDDELQGNGDGNVINGLGGNDTISGGDYAVGVDITVDRIDGGDGNDLIQGSGDAASQDGDDFLYGGAGNDTIYGAGGSVQIDGNDKIYGGDGNDVISGIGRNGGSENGDDFLVGGAGNDQLDGGWGGSDWASYEDATGDVTVSLVVTAGQNVGGGLGKDTLFEIENLKGGNFNDKLTGSAGDNILDGGAGNDQLDLSAGGNDTALGGKGDDTVVMGAALTAADTIDGGVGTDTVTLKGDYSAGLVFGATTMVNVETLTLLGGGSYKLKTNDATVAAHAVLTVDASALGAGDALNFDGSAEHDGTFNILAGAGSDTLSGGAGQDRFDLSKGGDDKASGGDGDDTFMLGAKLTASDKIDGGAGNDTAELNGDYSAGLTFAAATLVNVEHLELSGAHSYKLVMNDGNVAAGATLTVDASLLGAGDTLTFDGSAEHDGSFAVTGGHGADALTGGGGADKLNGGAGADVLQGNGGADILYGGGGDRFVYVAASDSTGAAFDTIEKFSIKTDKIDLWFTLQAVDKMVVKGDLSLGSFDADLALAVDAAHLGIHDAVVFTPDKGDLAGHAFLVIDANGVAGYQAGQDLVIALDQAAHLANLKDTAFV